MSRSAAAAFSILALVAMAGRAGASPYRIAQTLPIGGDGKWDYPSVDADMHRLYLSRATHVAVIDTLTGRLTGDIAGTAGVHGIAIAPDLKRGYISAGKADQVKVFDLQTLHIIASIPVGKKPDAILYEPVTRQVICFNGHGNDASVIDTTANAVVATVALGGAPEFARADGNGKVYVNIESTNELVALDVKERKVLARWRLPGCDRPTGLALDTLHRRSFSVCANSKITILDTNSGRSIATLPIGDGVDGAEFDPSAQNIFSANGEGTLTVVHEDDPEHFAIVQTLVTAPGARTIALDQKTHKLYLPTARFAPATASAGTESKPQPIPGSFFVLVVDSETATN